MADEQVEWVKYFAEVGNGLVREWPGRLFRRTKYVNDDLTDDAVWVSDNWERTLVFIAHSFGKDDGDFLVVEVPEREAALIRAMKELRPRGGPFTPEGQAWLVEHPEDRAAKYLGVVPEYDSAHQMVSPRDPILEGGTTAVRLGDGPAAGYLRNPTHEFVIDGGTPLSATTGFRWSLLPGGSWGVERVYG